MRFSYREIVQMSKISLRLMQISIKIKNYDNGLELLQ